MNKYSYYIYITALIIISFVMSTGCSTYLSGMSDPVILSRSPSLGATGVASNENIVITFNKKMDTTVNLGNAIKFDNPNNTASGPTSATTVEWSGDGKTLSIVNPGGWTIDKGLRVYWTVSKEAFKDEEGKSVIENAVIMDYCLSGFGIVGRSPYYGEQNVVHPKTLEVTFSMPISIESFAANRVTPSTEHTAGNPSVAAFYLSNGNRTINLQVSSWQFPASQVALMVSYKLISDETNTYMIPAGTMLWYYENVN